MTRPVALQRHSNIPESLKRRGDSFVLAPVKDPTGSAALEELWARALGGSMYEICCIPMFAYDLHAFDRVETDEGGQIVRLVSRGGHLTFRVFFKTIDQRERISLVERITSRGCSVEAHSPKLVAIDAPANLASEIAAQLAALESDGKLEYETGAMSARSDA